MDIALILKEAGPYTAPLCGAMVVAMNLLLADRKRLLAILAAKEQREMEVSDKRIGDALESARLLAESNATQKDTLSHHDRVLERLTERVSEWISSRG